MPWNNLYNIEITNALFARTLQFKKSGPCDSFVGRFFFRYSFGIFNGYNIIPVFYFFLSQFFSAFGHFI